MRIYIKHRTEPADTMLYRISRKDTDDYDWVMSLLNIELYDHYEGEPINEKVKEMDDCVLTEWNPNRFCELFEEIGNKKWKAYVDL